MPVNSPPVEAYVIKALELPACNHLAAGCPQPQQLEWIDRGTNRALRHSTVEQLARTFHNEMPSPSIRRVQQSAGLRATFASDEERNAFARYFRAALNAEHEQRKHLAAAVFADSDLALAAVAQLVALGIPAEAMCVMEKVAEVQGDKLPKLEGHSLAEVGRTTLAGGLVGAMLGAAVLAVPGIGAIAITGALFGPAVSLVTTITGIVGASGGAIAKMLTDFDVQGRSANHFASLVARGAVLVTIDARKCAISLAEIRDAIIALGGQLAGRYWPFDLRVQGSQTMLAQVTTAPALMATPYGTPLPIDQLELSAFARSRNAPSTSSRPASEIHQINRKNSSIGNQRAKAA